MNSTAHDTPTLYQRTSNRIGLLSGFVLFLAVLFQSSVFTIGYDEVGLKARLGTLAETVSPGLHFKLPFGIDYIEKVSASKIIVQEFGYRSQNKADATEAQLAAERSMITADLNIVEIAMAIHYQVEDPIAYLSSMRDTDDFVRSASETILREVVGQSQSGSLYTTSGQAIASIVEKELQHYIDRFQAGVVLKTVEIREISPPENVRPAFDRVNEARQEKERRITEAQRAASRRIAEAKSQAASIRTNAQAEALRRQTIAKRKLSEYTTFQEAYQQDPQILKTRLYVATLEEMLPQMKSVVITPQEQSAPVPFFNLDFDKGN